MLCRGQKRLENGILAKAKVDDKSIVSMLLETAVAPKTVGTLSAQFSIKDKDVAPKWGFALNTAQ